MPGKLATIPTTTISGLYPPDRRHKRRHPEGQHSLSRIAQGGSAAHCVRRVAGRSSRANFETVLRTIIVRWASLWQQCPIPLHISRPRSSARSSTVTRPPRAEAVPRQRVLAPNSVCPTFSSAPPPSELLTGLRGQTRREHLRMREGGRRGSQLAFSRVPPSLAHASPGPRRARITAIDRPGVEVPCLVTV